MKLKISILIFFSCFFLSAGLSGQKADKKILITGHVTDKQGTPVPGAMILIDNKSTNVVTDEKGFYKIKVKPYSKGIYVFTLGKGVGEALLEGKTVVDIVLNSPAAGAAVAEKSVKEDDVNIGYSTVDKKNMTSSVSRIDGTENKSGRYNNIYEMIKGQVPGVEINGTRIRIQGATSYMLSSDPLLVVDGTIVETINNIHPMEVSSIEVLKGNAASIYGARGSNGVILITLKGSEGIRK